MPCATTSVRAFSNLPERAPDVAATGAPFASAAAPPTIAVVHAAYQQRGGEDGAVAAHEALLEAHGHRVVRHHASNTALHDLTPLQQATTTLWNGRARAALRALLRHERPALLHVHNTFPWFSPAIYGVARQAGIPVVQTLHNYRLICPNGLLFRDGARCVACVGKTVAWPAVTHRCYRESRAASAVTAAMLTTHRAAGTWQRDVSAYIALTNAARDRFIAGGLPADRVHVQPGFLASDPGVGRHEGGFALYVGRLSPEKGVHTMLRAWRAAWREGRELRIVGDGPLHGSLDRDVPGVRFLGARDNADVLALMRDATVLIFPSECDEGFPVTLLEAFATALPVIAGAHGAMADVMTHDHTGRLFESGNAAALAAQITWAFEHPDACATLGITARRRYADAYTPARAYARLRALYDALLTPAHQAR